MLKVEDVIASWKALAVILLLLTVVGGIQAVAHQAIQSNTQTWKGECMPMRWESNDEGVTTAILHCGDMQDEISAKGKAITAYLNNPGPLTCRVFKDNKATCEERPRASQHLEEEH